MEWYSILRLHIPISSVYSHPVTFHWEGRRPRRPQINCYETHKKRCKSLVESLSLEIKFCSCLCASKCIVVSPFKMLLYFPSASSKLKKKKSQIYAFVNLRTCSRSSRKFVLLVLIQKVKSLLKVNGPFFPISKVLALLPASVGSNLISHHACCLYWAAVLTLHRQLAEMCF